MSLDQSQKRIAEAVAFGNVDKVLDAVARVVCDKASSKKVPGILLDVYCRAPRIASSTRLHMRVAQAFFKAQDLSKRKDAHQDVKYHAAIVELVTSILKAKLKRFRSASLKAASEAVELALFNTRTDGVEKWELDLKSPKLNARSPRLFEFARARNIHNAYDELDFSQLKLVRLLREPTAAADACTCIALAKKKKAATMDVVWFALLHGAARHQREYVWTSQALYAARPMFELVLASIAFCRSNPVESSRTQVDSIDSTAAMHRIDEASKRHLDFFERHLEDSQRMQYMYEAIKLEVPPPNPPAGGRAPRPPA